MKESKLSELRNKIDEIDHELLKLLAKRGDFVEKVGELKHQNGEKGSFIRSGREATMIKRLVKKGAGKLPEKAIFSIWRSIISASLAMENDLKIAVHRSSDFESSRIITEYFGSFSKYIMCKSLDELLDKIDRNTVGVVDISGNWWAKLSNEKYSNIKVFAKLSKNLYAIANIKPEKTGSDKTLIVSRGQNKKFGKEIANLRSFYLYESDQFIESDSELADGAVVVGNYAKD